MKGILVQFMYKAYKEYLILFIFHRRSVRSHAEKAMAPHSSCLENPMDGGAWKAAVHGVAEGRTRLSDFTFIFHFHALEKEMATHSIVLAWRIPGTGEPGGCCLWGCTESDMTEATQQGSKQARSHGLPRWQVKNPPANAGGIRDVGSIS